jgi:hypothetical protein
MVDTDSIGLPGLRMVDNEAFGDPVLACSCVA